MKKIFSFGKNWQRYVSLIGEDEVEKAKESLLKYLPLEEYKGKIFIDVGCGSGIFSLAALLLGCKTVYSFDIDKNSIKATQKLKEEFSYLFKNKTYNWKIFIGDILDQSLVKNFNQRGDIVYSWGVLHHTGQMWQAIKNAAKIVKNNGYFIIAIYNYAPSSPFWLKVKKFYNSSNSLIKLFLIIMLFLEKVFRRVLSLKNPFWKERGMNVLTDVIDCGRFRVSVN